MSQLKGEDFVKLARVLANEYIKGDWTGEMVVDFISGLSELHAAFFVLTFIEFVPESSKEIKEKVKDRINLNIIINSLTP